MACFNWTNTMLYPNPTSSEYDGGLSQALVFKQVDASAPEISTNSWSACGQQYYDDVARWPTSLYPEANFASTFYEIQTQGYDQWIYPEHHWPSAEQSTQPNQTTLNYATSNHTTSNYIAPNCNAQNYLTPNYTAPNYDASTNTATLEAPKPQPSPSNNQTSPLRRVLKESNAHQARTGWEDNQSGQTTDTPCVNSQTPHRPSNSSIRTKPMIKRRHQPYAPPRAPNERTNAEADPSNLAAPRISNVDLPPENSPRGIPEATTDAEKCSSTAEEDATSRKTRRPRGAGNPRPARDRYQGQVRRLCNWAKGWGNFAKHPSHKESLALALEIIKKLHPVPASDEPSLSGCYGLIRKDGERSLVAERESVRRKGIRGLYEELSRYYKLPGEGMTWKRPRLLSNVLRDVESLPSRSVTKFP